MELDLNTARLLFTRLETPLYLRLVAAQFLLASFETIRSERGEAARLLEQHLLRTVLLMAALDYEADLDGDAREWIFEATRNALLRRYADNNPQLEADSDLDTETARAYQIAQEELAAATRRYHANEAAEVRENEERAPLEWSEYLPAEHWANLRDHLPEDAAEILDPYIGEGRALPREDSMAADEFRRALAAAQFTAENLARAQLRTGFGPLTGDYLRHLGDSIGETVSVHYPIAIPLAAEVPDAAMYTLPATNEHGLAGTMSVFRIADNEWDVELRFPTRDKVLTEGTNHPALLEHFDGALMTLVFMGRPRTVAEVVVHVEIDEEGHLTGSTTHLGEPLPKPGCLRMVARL